MKKSILFLFLALLLLVGVASAAYSEKCCVKSYIPPGDAAPILVTDPCPVGYYNYVSCFDPSIQKYKDDADDVGCCCLDGTVYNVEGGNPSFPQYTSVKYCEALGYISKPVEDSNCAEVCSTATETNINLNDYYVTVTGYVYVDLPDQEPYLYEDGAIIASMYDYAEVTTDSNGHYSLGRTPGDPMGSNEFRANIPYGREIGCTPAVVNKVLTENTEINFTLTCWEQTPDCTPTWIYSQWSECYPFDGYFYQIRTATDEANNGLGCGNTIGLLPLKKVCEGTISYGDCGNNVFDEGTTEQCDIVNDQEKFLHPTEKTVLNELSCKEVDDAYQAGNVGCSSTCTYDYSECELTCNPNVCRNKVDCDNECGACEGNTVVCGDPCDDAKPEFLDLWRNETENPLFSESRNVYDLYDLMEPTLTPAPVLYNETTSNVRLQWYYDGQCTASIYGFKLIVCEESAEGSNTCKANTKQEILVTTPGKTEEWINGVLKPQTSFCYNVCALNEDGSSSCAINNTELWPCFMTGDEECMTDTHEPGLNCKYDATLDQIVPQGCSRHPDYGYTNLTLKAPSTIECSGKICVETTYDNTAGPNYVGATCVTPAVCGTCNGLFGIYAGYDLFTKIEISNENGVANYESVGCSELQYSFMNAPEDVPEVGTNYVGLCYKDSTRTSFDQFDTCEAVTSCYNYKSKAACENDPCFKFTDMRGESPVNGCEWNPLTTKDSNGNDVDELSLGVCAPVKEELQVCGLCDTVAPTNFCTNQECGLYGSCYFKDEEYHGRGLFEPLKEIVLGDTRNSYVDLVPTCLREDDVACYFYDSQEECEGENHPVSVDVIYDDTGIVGHQATRVFGSNAVTRSADLLNIGLCRWNADSTEERLIGCVKDADGSQQVELAELKDDCASSTLATKGLDCLKDKTPPTTDIIFKEPEQASEINGNMIPVYGLGETAEMDFPASDDVSTSEEVITRAAFLNLDVCGGCIPDFVIGNLSLPSSLQIPNKNIDTIRACYEKGCELYPQRKIEPTNPWFKKFNDLESGEYALLYYSEDKSHNLEVMKMKHLYVDNSSPIITIDEPVIKSFKQSEDDYKSDMNVTFHTDEDSVCEGRLYDVSNPGWSFSSGDIIAEGMDFQTSYLKLLDGYYTFVVACVDEYQNVGIASREIEVQGDMSIRDPRPRGKVFNLPSDVVLSINTSTEATACYYSMDRYDYPEEQKFVSMPFDSSKNNQYHTQSFSQFDLSQVGTWLGNYEFTLFTACDFADGNRTEGNFGDVISFSIDNRSPETMVQVKEGNNWVELTENLNFTDERLVRITCSDRNELTPNLYFGCDKIRYCFADHVDNLDTFTVNDCDGNEWLELDKATRTEGVNGTVYQDMLIKDDDIGGGKRIYYYSIDKGGNVESINRKNLRIRDIEFVDPEFRLSTLQE
ncbi:hypothetical protein JXA48_00200 [Candidatus Woesearchaeota archaeon]|nr:hypothetical protein [Candidatus Woesearchaeota archaeon]